MNFTGIMIGSEDPKRLAEYYAKLFGAPAWDEGGYIGWQIGSGSVTVGAHSEVHGKSTHPGRVMWTIESSDVRGDFDRLTAAGAIVVREPYGFDGQPADMLVATLADPDDNYFQLMSPMGPESGG